MSRRRRSHAGSRIRSKQGGNTSSVNPQIHARRVPSRRQRSGLAFDCLRYVPFDKPCSVTVAVRSTKLRMQDNSGSTEWDEFLEFFREAEPLLRHLGISLLQSCAKNRRLQQKQDE